MTPIDSPPSSVTIPTAFALHDYGTGEKLSMRIPAFQPSGNPLETYRIAAGFYSTGDSSAWVLSSEQFQNFLQVQALSQNLPLGLIQMLGPREEVSGQRKLAVKRKLLAQILELSNTIEAKRGILSESYPLIREDRER